MLENLTCFGKTTDTYEKVDHTPFGIDLGTTNSAISVAKNKHGAEIITLVNGKHTMPSVIAWRGGDHFLVGEEAFDADVDDSVVKSVKRYMQDPHKTITLKYNGEEKIMTPTEVSAEILKGLVKQTGGTYGEVKDVVVTVPAYFNQTGINNTKEACRLAGLNCVHILREPTAAALNYDLDKSGKKVQYALVYDLGGGTFDISLIRISERKIANKLYKLYDIEPPKDDHSTGKLIEPQCIDGDCRLGGDDYDEEIYKCLLQQLDQILKEKFPDETYDLTKIQPIDKRRLLKKVSQAKTSINNVHGLFVELDLADGKHVAERVYLSKDLFRQAFLPIYQRTKVKLNNVLRSAHCDVDTIILMGGSTKNPLLLEMLGADYPGFKINSSLDPDESVAKGAGIKARNYLYGDSAVQIFDILPLNIGILSSGKVLPLIKANSQLPINAEKLFTTSYDNQEFVSIKLYQGNSTLPEECELLGELVIDGIKKAPAGEPNLGIRLAVNADCIMTCKAVIDGIEKVKQLNLNAASGNSTTLKSEDRNVIRWKRAAKNLPKDAREKLEIMLQGYPETVTAKDISTYLKQFKRTIESEVKNE